MKNLIINGNYLGKVENYKLDCIAWTFEIKGLSYSLSINPMKVKKFIGEENTIIILAV